MGFMEKILGGSGSSTEDYVELDIDDFDTDASEVGVKVHVAEIDGQEDVIAIKDAVYDGDMVIADITRLRTEDRTVEHVVDELRQVAQEVGGDIVQKGDDQLIVTPNGIAISRSKLNRH
ncbi:cell division protein SepF [Halobacterium wangiae]|uniref:cell division protein SepF n=1 Tax=Halobacterium wangiae TaxID=2902623 RepID=UPI001E614123|nr:cell division protein SepF [Halobacterium wangiae]